MPNFIFVCGMVVVIDMALMSGLAMMMAKAGWIDLRK